ncbi:MAG TPA: hypothetical protein VHG30_08440 [Microvirga sp.]|nr:hypothetical protein [Microvirga sp.]
MRSRFGGLVSTPLAVPWFRAGDYARCREMMDDRDRLPSTFAEWERGAQDRLDGLSGFGQSLEIVEIDPDEFAAFCAAQGLRPNGMARNAYACVKLAQKQRENGRPN